MSSHHRLHHSHARVPPPLSPTDVPRRIIALEDRIAAQYGDLQKLLADNQRLAATHVALKQDLAASRQDLRLLADSAVRAKADADAEIRALHEGSARAEEEARRTEAMREELVIVRLDVTRLVKERDEMADMTRGLRVDVEKARADVGRVSEAKREIDFMRNEIDRGRAAIEYEKKAHAENLEQSQVMEKNMISMAREVEKLRAELANAEKRGRAAAAARPGPPYGESYGHNDAAYGGSAYANAYGFHQAQRGADGVSQYGSQYGSGAVPLGSYDIQRAHLHR